jgi:hypothetical protein
MEWFQESVALALGESGIGFGQLLEHSPGWAIYMLLLLLYLLRSRNESFIRAQIFVWEECWL